MRIFNNIIFLVFIFFTLSYLHAEGASANITAGGNIMVNENNTTYYSEKKPPNTVMYISKEEDKPTLIVPDGEVKLKKPIDIPNIQSDNLIIEPQETIVVNRVESKKNKHQDKNLNNKSDKQKKDKQQNNVVVSDVQNGILSENSRRINAIYPDDEPFLNNTYPGYRGTNQLVIYTRAFGRTTGTNEFGKEAVVEDGVVTKLTGAN